MRPTVFVIASTHTILKEPINVEIPHSKPQDPTGMAQSKHPCNC